MKPQGVHLALDVSILFSLMIELFILITTIS